MKRLEKQDARGRREAWKREEDWDRWRKWGARGGREKSRRKDRSMKERWLAGEGGRGRLSRFIARLPCYSCISAFMFDETRWLPFHARLYYKIFTLIFKAQLRLASKYYSAWSNNSAFSLIKITYIINFASPIDLTYCFLVQELPWLSLDSMLQLVPSLQASGRR